MSLYNILTDHHAEIAELAAAVGIDWNAHCNETLPFKTSAAQTKTIDKKHKGACGIIADVKTTKDGREYPFIYFKSFKEGGKEEKFSGYKYLTKAQKDPKDAQKSALEAAKRQAERKAAQAEKEANETALNLEFRKIVLDHASTFHQCQNSAYLTKKGLTEFTGLFTTGRKINPTTGKEYGGVSIAYPLFNEAYDHVGYEFIEDKTGKKQSSKGSGGGVRFASIKGNKPAPAPVEPVKPAIELSALDCRIVSLIRDGVSTYEDLEKHVSPVELYDSLTSLIDGGFIVDDGSAYGVISDLW